MLESRRRDPGMAQVQCVRCGNQGEAITEPLFLGKLETQVKANICAPCWGEWVKMRVMVINEYHVNLGDESGRALVREQMLNFLKLSICSLTRARPLSSPRFTWYSLMTMTRIFTHSPQHGAQMLALT